MNTILTLAMIFIIQMILYFIFLVLMYPRTPFSKYITKKFKGDYGKALNIILDTQIVLIVLNFSVIMLIASYQL